MTGKTTFKDRALRAIAILGLIAILLLGAWGIIQIAFTLYGFLGASTPTPVVQTAPKPEAMVVTAPGVINSGVPFTLSFSHQNATGNYSYQISYSCAANLSLQAPLPTGSLQTVPCNTPFNYTNATSNVELTATVTGTAQAATSFNVTAINLATKAASVTGAAASTVLPVKAATTPVTTTKTPTKTTSTPGSTYVAAAHTTTLHGLPDLSVSMGNVVDNGGRYSVQFTIKNSGTNIAPAGWTFNAVLPTNPAYTYTSSQQQALYPGDKIVYTLGFTMQNNNAYGYTTPTNSYGTSYASGCGYGTNYTYNGTYTYPNISYGCTTGSGTNYSPSYYTSYPTSYSSNYNYSSYSFGPYVMTVTADPSNYISETSEANNSASVTLSNY